jgi:hypothetical protein
MLGISIKWIWGMDIPLSIIIRLIIYFIYLSEMEKEEKKAE